MEQKQAELVKDFPSAFSKRKITVNEPITPRENLLRLLRGEKPVWMPCSLDIQAVDPWCVPDNVARGLYSTDHRIPDEEKGGRDMFGQEWVYVPTAMGSMVRQGEELFEDVEEWPDKVRFPDVDAWDWAGAKAMLEPYIDDERLHESTIFTGFFERLIAFMGMENALLAMIDEDEQEFIHALFARLCDTYEQIIVHLQEQFHTDMIQLHDDWGNQLAPFFRTDTMETLIAPYIKRIVSFCHDRGLRFHLHSCGMNDQNVPLMIECGVDYWSPQISADEDRLMELYAPRLAIATRAVVPEDASPEEADARAKALVEHYAPLGKVFLFRNPFNLGQRAADAYYEAIYRYSKAYYAAV